MQDLWISSDLENVEFMYPGTRYEAAKDWDSSDKPLKEITDEQLDSVTTLELVKTIENSTVYDEVLEPEASRKTIRPETLEDFVGQEQLKRRVIISVKAALKRQEPPRHMLFHGPAGFGKTTLAAIIANELHMPIINVHAPSLETTNELVAVFLELDRPACIFIDEIHRLRKRAQESLYSIMEDFRLAITDSNRHMLKPWRPDEIIDLFTIANQKQFYAQSNINHFIPKFTLIGATTEFGTLSSPLRDRFGEIHSLSDYSVEDMVRLVKRTCSVLDVSIGVDAANDIAKRARSTPRHANRLVDSCRDVADVLGDGVITHEVVTETMEMNGVDELGLEPDDRKILETLIITYGGGPAGIEALSLASNISETTIVEVIEPHLLRLGLLDRTQKGREVTSMGYSHLDVKVLG